MDEYVANLNYKVGKISKVGYLEVGDTTVPVCTYDCPGSEYYQGVGVSHENYLHSFFPDKEAGVMVHRHYRGAIKLSAYLKKLQISDEEKGKPVLIFDIKDVNGAMVYQRPYVNPSYRSVIKSITRLIATQHKKSRTLTPFDIDNFIYIGVVKSKPEENEFNENDVKPGEEVKFVGIGFYEGNENAANRRDDFMCLHKIVMEMFQGFPIPVELKDWLDLIKSLKFESVEDEDEDGLLLLHHVALMSPKESVLFFQSCHDTVLNLDQKLELPAYRAAIKNMGHRYNWFTMFNKYKSNGIVFPTDDCFVFDGKNKKYHYQPNQYRRIQSHEVTVSMFKCCRDITVHVGRHVDRGSEVTDTSVERMVMEVFGEDIMELQKHLRKFNCLIPFVTNH